MSQTVQRRWGWVWLACLGIIAASIGIGVGANKTGNLCGSVFKPDNLSAEYADALSGTRYGSAVADCKDAIAAAATPTWFLIGLGVVLVLAGVIVMSITNRPAGSPVVQAAAPPAPSVTAQLEELARLKEQGLISDDEFDAKRTELLARF